MTWKQPIPVTFTELKNDPFADNLFAYLIRRARNEDGEIEVHGEIISLKRGQLIVGRTKLAKAFGLKESEQGRVVRKLTRLQKVNNLVNIEGRKYCTVVTIKNYDSIVNMNTQMNNWRLTGEQLVNTNKSVKSGKSVKGGVDELENEAKELLLLVNNLYDKKYSSVKAWLGNYKKLRDDYTLEDFKTAIKNIKHHKWLSGQEDGQDKIDMVILTRTSQDWIGKLLSFGEEKKLDPKTSLIQAGYKFWEKGDK